MFDLVVALESSAKNGFTQVDFIDDVTQQLTNASDYIAKADGVLYWVQGRTANSTNFAGVRFRRVADPNWHYVLRAEVDEPLVPRVTVVGESLSRGSVITVEADNGNNAQVDALVLAVGNAGISWKESDPVVSGGKWVSATGSTTQTASAWTAVPLTWDYAYERDGVYAILALAGYAATGYAARLVYSQAPSSAWRPGVPLSRSAAQLRPLWSTGFGQFRGDVPPSAEFLSSAADAAQTLWAYIVKVG